MSIKKGEIKSQDPGEGEKVKENTTITVVISSGEEAKKVPRAECTGQRVSRRRSRFSRTQS